MQSVIKKFFNYFGLVLFIFIFINIFISVSWKIYSKFNKKENAYNKTQLELLNLSKTDSDYLFKETWIDRSYVYDQFTEYREKEKENGKFVNISKNEGRQVNNNINCKKNLLFYGSSMTFGYNDTDSHTFSQLFKNILDEKDIFGCVYNYGRAGYDSTRENILFINHIAENKINKGDFVFFLNVAGEQGKKKGLNTDYLTYAQNLAVAKNYSKFIGIFKFFWDSLPLNQFLKRFKEKFISNNQDLEFENQKKNSLNEIVSVFEKNIKIRNNICEAFKLNCYTFLHPQSGLHGIYFKNFNKSNYPQTGIYNFEDEKIKEMIKQRSLKYSSMLKINGIIDLGNAFKDAKKITYIDRNHYSPYGHLLIAKAIFKLIEKDLLVGN